MSHEPSAIPDLASIDLALSFAPAWVKEATSPQEIARLAAKHPDRGDKPERRGDSRGGGGQRQDRPPMRRAGGGDRSDRKKDRYERPASPPRPAPMLTGWDVRYLPHPQGVEGLAKQIKTSAKAYPLFDLARLVLEKSERYQVELKRASDSAPALFQLESDGTLWTRESDAATWALAKQLDKFYRRETITVDPPKGNYTLVAVCGMSGALLGPPNYHDYQDKIRQIHAKQYATMPFEAYKSRIRTERDEARVEQWKQEQSSRDVFFPLDTPEGAEPVKLETMADVERHFRQHYASKAVIQIRDRVLVPGPAAVNDSAPGIIELTRAAGDQLVRFPLPLAHLLGEKLASKGLQIFKAHENITCIGVARPHALDRQTTPVSDRLSAMLTYLEEHPATPRNEQWQALVSLFPLTEAGPEARESAVAADLFWLLHQGHVIDYAGRGLEVARRQNPRPQPKAGKPSHPKAQPARQGEAKIGEAKPPVPEEQG